MSRRSGKKKGHKGNSGGAPTLQRKPQEPQPPLSPTKAPEVEKIEGAHDEAVAIATDDDLAGIGSDPRPAEADLDSLWETVREARDIYLSAAKRSEDEAEKATELQGKLESRISDSEKETAQLAVEKEDIASREKAVKAHEKKVANREKAAANTEAGFTERETKLRERELNAEAGFNAERQAMLEALENSVRELRAAIATAEKEFSQKRAEWLEEETAQIQALSANLGERSERCDADLDRKVRETEQALASRRNELEDEFAARERVLQADQEQLKAEQRVAESQKRRQEFEAADLDELKADLEGRVEQRAAKAREELEHQLAAREAQLDQARSDRDRLEAMLREREEADRRFGQRTPDEVLEELETLRRTRGELEAERDRRPDSAATERLEKLESEQETWHAERLDLLRQRDELKRRLAYADTDVAERETQRDVIKSMESQRQLLHEAHQQIRSEIDDLLSREESKSPFPACTGMDRDRTLQIPEPMTDDIGDLAAFVADLQQRIAFDPEHPKRRLYYSQQDLRSFLAGMAMSRLVMLQGISGTGKTSLPIAFARAIGPADPRDRTLAVIEVEAGWRDPQDLVGHYNVFEKRFYEKEFLKALYRAHTPRWADAVHIVLLDEMNLSHPEQYFSDLISALELKPEDQRLTLMTHAVEPSPAHFDEESRSKLPIPQNVWFVGTANHDETTKDFADKTYDRAHVMEFPQVPEPFDVNKPITRPAVSFTALQAAFEEAIRRRQKTAQSALEFLDSEVRKPLRENFEVGWGPRLERQMLRYIPVVVAAGGTVGEATDHVLAMRLLRKLKNRHDNRPEHLEELRQRILEAWPGLDKKYGRPVRSDRVLCKELRRLNRAPEDCE